MDMIDKFIKGDGPPRLFFYYQPPYKVVESGEIQFQSGVRPELVITDGKSLRVSNCQGDSHKLKGKGLYFARNKAPGQSINAGGSNDNEVLFGEISGKGFNLTAQSTQSPV